MKEFNVEIWKPESLQRQFRNHLELEYSNFWQVLTNQRTKVGSDSFQSALYISETIKKERKILEENLRGYSQGNINELQKSIENSTNIICSTLNQGFEQINNQLDEINYSLDVLNDNLALIHYEQQKTNEYLLNIQKILLNQSILITIPDIEKQKAHKISEGLRYLSAANTWDSANFNKAASFFEEALKINQYDFLVLEKLGFIYLYSKKLSNYNNSVKYYKEAINEMSIILQTKQIPRSFYLLKDGSKEFDINKSLDDIYKLLANTLLCYSKANYLVGNFSEAVRATQKASEMFPKDSKISFQLAIYYVANKQVKEAIEIIKKLIESKRYMVLKVLNTLELITQSEIVNFLKVLYESTKELAHKCYKEQTTTLHGSEYDVKNSVVRDIMKPIEDLMRRDNYIDYLQAVELLNKSYDIPLNMGIESNENEFFNFPMFQKQKRINEILSIESSTKENLATIQEFYKLSNVPNTESEKIRPFTFARGEKKKRFSPIELIFSILGVLLYSQIFNFIVKNIVFLSDGSSHRRENSHHCEKLIGGSEYGGAYIPLLLLCPIIIIYFIKIIFNKIAETNYSELRRQFYYCWLGSIFTHILMVFLGFSNSIFFFSYYDTLTLIGTDAISVTFSFYLVLFFMFFAIYDDYVIYAMEKFSNKSNLYSSLINGIKLKYNNGLKLVAERIQSYSKYSLIEEVINDVNDYVLNNQKQVLFVIPNDNKNDYIKMVSKRYLITFAFLILLFTGSFCINQIYIKRYCGLDIEAHYNKVDFLDCSDNDCYFGTGHSSEVTEVIMLCPENKKVKVKITPRFKEDTKRREQIIYLDVENGHIMHYNF